MTRCRRILPILLTILFPGLLPGTGPVPAAAQVLEVAAIPSAPDRGQGEGDGPFDRLILRGATIIDGTGAPPRGPVDIVIEGDRIAEVRSVGYPLVEVDSDRRPEAGTREIDAEGMFVMPGFVDLHAHIGGDWQSVPAEYVYKLWMAHGVTTIRDPGSGNGVDWTLRARDRSAADEIVAPTIFAYAFAGVDWPGGRITTPEIGREYVRWVKERGLDGIKFAAGHDGVSYNRPVMEAMLGEAKALGVGTQAHLGQMVVSEVDAMDAARWGLGSLEHWYGLPESLFADRTIQDYPVDYNYNDEYHRFGQAGRLWAQAAAPGSPTWNRALDEFLDLGFVFDPTMTIYQASRDEMVQREAEWVERYTHPGLLDFFEPGRGKHGSYWFDWSTNDEVAWKENYGLWQRFLRDYVSRGGKVTTGSDSGFIYKTYGFGYIQELELLREAGFHPAEIIRSATLWGAETLMEPTGAPADFGAIRPGWYADLVVVEENPLENLKVLYGTGAVQLNDETGEVERVGGVKYTIKRGIVYDAKRLLDDVARLVDEAKRSGQPVSQEDGS